MKVLDPLRREIDAVDDRIVELLAVRQGIVRRVAAVKQANDIPVVLGDRIDEVKDRNAAHGVAQGLDPDYVRRVFEVIIDEACALEGRLTEQAAGQAPGQAAGQTPGQAGGQGTGGANKKTDT